MIWTRAKRAKDGVRLVVSDSENGDVDLMLATAAAEELGHALVSRRDISRVDALSADGDRATVSAANDEIGVTIEGDAPFRFALGADAPELGAQLLEARAEAGE